MTGRWLGTLACASLLVVVGCGYPSQDDGQPTTTEEPPAIDSFTAAEDSVFVGESTTLTAVFSGDSASIEGIGPVESGRPVATPALARQTTFTLTVRRGTRAIEALASVSATYRNRFRELAPSPEARRQHLAMALPDGGALVMGGNSSETPNVPDTDTTLRFDPVSETLVPGPQLAFTAQAFRTAPVRLEGGAFLLVGGGINSSFQIRGDGAVATQAFDAAGSSFARVGDLHSRHAAGATATLLADGSVLVVGGDVGVPTATERYDTASGRWALAGDMVMARRGQTATLLADGRVLVVGGFTCCDATGEVVTGTVEIYDPADGGFQPTGPLSTARAFHAATLLPDGRVLVTGGIVDGARTTASTEIYDPSTGQFLPGGAMQVGRDAHSAIVLTDGRVLVLGGERASTETDVFDPVSSRWSAGPSLHPAWAASTATLLSSGKVLVFGGEDAGAFPVSTVFLYE